MRSRKPDMKDIARQIRSLISAVEPQLSRMNYDEMSFKPDPHKWSKKEILGHLIDSAANNHQRFVRAVNKVASSQHTIKMNGFEFSVTMKYLGPFWSHFGLPTTTI